jgi:hypothetical protein
MNAKARQALLTIRACVGVGRYRLLAHFAERLHWRGFVWADVLGVIDAPSNVRPGRGEAWRRPRWILSGRAADGLPLTFLCILDRDERRRFTVFVTIFKGASR